MLRFVSRSILFFVLLVGIVFGCHKVYSYFSMPKGANACYVWGDSQIFQGLDLPYLDAHSQYHFYTAAQHGASVYDFLVFAESVPANARVLISLSISGVLRAKHLDRNMSALSFDALAALRQQNYPYRELYTIFKNNLYPHALFADSTCLYVDRDTVITTLPMAAFKKNFMQKHSYMDCKEHLFMKGMNILKQKNCKIIALALPYHAQLREVQAASPLLPYITKIALEQASMFSGTDTITLDVDKNIYYDHTHLNKRGADIVSEHLVPYLDFKNCPLLLVVTEKAKNIAIAGGPNM